LGFIGKDTGVPLKSWNSAWEKKGGGGKVDGLSAEWVWKMARASAKGKPTWWLAKRRSVTVTENDGLNPIREAQDEGSRIGTKPSGVMTR
jgi:hypothetical protein